MPCCCIGTSKSRRARISKFRQVSAGAGEVPPTSYHAGAGKAVSKFHRSHDIHVWCLPRREKQERGRRPGAAAPRSNGHSRKGKSDRNETFVNVLFVRVLGENSIDRVGVVVGGCSPARRRLALRRSGALVKMLTSPRLARSSS